MPYFDTLQTLREKAGLRIAVVAREANIDRSTIKRVERHHNSTPETLHSIVRALNSLHYNKNGPALNYDNLVTPKSKYGGK